ncbi:MAG: DUF2798 domain-containing protein [Bacteroidia bacterium]|nr:DUF2798 domain-containing protein [Bacteroidia bacterium]
MKQKIAFALIMGIVTTGIISFTLISINLGFTERFLKIWLKSWAMAYTVVIPAILIIGPRVQKVVDHLFGEAVNKESLNAAKNEYHEVWNMNASWDPKVDLEKGSAHDRKRKRMLIDQNQEMETLS